MKRNCTNCKFGYTYDVGYSNYTVEGTHFDCYKDFNPEFPIDFEYWENHDDEIYNYAIECAGHMNGEGPHYYVEDSVDSKDFD